MKSYEGVFIFKPDLVKEGLEKIINQTQEIIEKQKGSIDEKVDLGKKKLTYPIKKYKEGIYSFFKFNIDPEAISKIKKSFGLNESILRVLIVKA